MTKFPLLRAEDIEVKVKQVTKTGAIALLYKTARVDMAMLDEVAGAENWENDYKEIDGVLFCGIGITDNGRTTWKWSNGIESRSDGDGNEKKGEASDAFKRAGFMWGIGRELYTAPFIFLNVPTESDGEDGKKREKFKLQDKYATFEVRTIDYDKNAAIKKVVITDNKGNTVYPKSKNEQSEPAPTAEPEIPRRQQVARWLNSNGGVYTSEDVVAFLKNRGRETVDDLSGADFKKLLKLCEKGAL